MIVHLHSPSAEATVGLFDLHAIGISRHLEDLVRIEQLSTARLEIVHEKFKGGRGVAIV
jgi:hypothetical protein